MNGSIYLIHHGTGRKSNGDIKIDKQIKNSLLAISRRFSSILYVSDSIWTYTSPAVVTCIRYTSAKPPTYKRILKKSNYILHQNSLANFLAVSLQQFNGYQNKDFMHRLDFISVPHFTQSHLQLYYRYLLGIPLYSRPAG